MLYIHIIIIVNITIDNNFEKMYRYSIFQIRFRNQFLINLNVNIIF